MIRILGLDAGLTLAWACFALEGRTLTLGQYGCERYPGKPHGNAGREDVHRWARGVLERFAAADEVARDAPIVGIGNQTNRASLGAFAAVEEFAMARHPAPKGGKVYGQTSKAAYVRRCALLADKPIPTGRVEYRAILSQLTGLPLEDTKGERQHCMDAIAAGIHHAYTAHLWHPDGWQDPKVARRRAETEAYLSAFRR
jgi:hypothetical protein